MQDSFSVRFAGLRSRGAELLARGADLIARGAHTVARGARRVTRDQVLYSAGLGLALLIGAGVWFLGPFHRVEPAAQLSKVPQPAFSFQDDRPLSAAAAAAAETVENAPDASAIQAAPQPAATTTASFTDTRPLPGGDTKFGHVTPGSNGAAPQFNDARTLAATPFEDGRLATTSSFSDTRPVASPSFNDERLIDKSAFKDDRPVAQPSFSDERTVQSPSFSDERAIGTASFSDQRSIAAPSFSDARPLAAETGATTALATEPAATVPPAVPPALAGMPVQEAPTALAKIETAAAAAPAPEPQTQSPATPSEPVKAANLPTLVAIAPSQLRLDAAPPCKETEITTEPLDGGCRPCAHGSSS